MRILLFMLTLCAFLFGAQQMIHKETIANSEVYIINLQKSEMSKDALIANNDAEKEIIAKTKIPQNNHNIVLIKNPNFIALIDTGFPQNQATLKEFLSGLNVAFSDITHIIISHAHFDHTGGILDKDGKNNFPNATLLIDENDFKFAQDNESTKSAVNSFEKREFFSHERAILANELEIWALQAYGHTPGHNILMIGEGADKIAFWADLLHIYHIQKDNPQISVVYDSNKAQAAQTRRDFIEKFKREKTRVIGAHVPFLKPFILD